MDISDQVQKKQRTERDYRLKRIIKENHLMPIKRVWFHPEYPNLLMTLGANQMNLYDNTHLDMLSQYVHAEDLSSCCWIRHPEDVWIALGTKDIHIVSVAYSQVSLVLKGHTDTILDMDAFEFGLVSCASDAIRLWHLLQEREVALFQQSASIVKIHPSGSYFLAGSLGGSLQKWILDQQLLDPPENSPIETFDDFIPLDSPHNASIQSIDFTKTHILSKSSDGKVCLWNDTEIVFKIYLDHCTPCRLDLCSSLDLFCVGDAEGTVSIYSSVNGCLLQQVDHKRVTKRILGCAFSSDGEHLLFAGDQGLLWRYMFSFQIRSLQKFA
ncbi:WD40-repeat-containing domain protein [Gorgonomyces haynaldii]|nr:WD40-repeat-containing domain protein [Gorgonomyces haynaldii]